MTTVDTSRIYRSEFQKLINWNVAHWEDGRATIVCRVRPEFLNRGSNVHGGLIATLIDAVGGHAGLGPVPADPSQPGSRGVTLSLTINYIGAVRAGDLTVTGVRTGGGNTVSFVRMEVVDSEGQLIAEGTGTFRRFRRED